MLHKVTGTGTGFGIYCEAVTQGLLALRYELNVQAIKLVLGKCIFPTPLPEYQKVPSQYFRGTSGEFSTAEVLPTAGVFPIAGVLR